MINVVVVDNQKNVYEGFASLLTMHDAFYCVKTFSNGFDFLSDIQSLNVDVVLMDIQMPKINGIEVVKKLRTFDETIRVLMLTTFHDKAYIIDSLQAGANGYIVKDTPFETITHAIKTVHEKGAYLQEQITLSVVDYLHHTNIKEQDHIQSWKEKYHLTNRELDVMRMVKEGLSNVEISKKLYISKSTVKNHVSNIMDKLDLRERHLLIVYALSGVRPNGQKTPN